MVLQRWNDEIFHFKTGLRYIQVLFSQVLLYNKFGVLDKGYSVRKQIGVKYYHKVSLPVATKVCKYLHMELLNRYSGYTERTIQSAPYRYFIEHRINGRLFLSLSHDHLVCQILLHMTFTMECSGSLIRQGHADNLSNLNIE